jgi:hypothetical protein
MGWRLYHAFQSLSKAQSNRIHFSKGFPMQLTQKSASVTCLTSYKLLRVTKQCNSVRGAALLFQSWKALLITFHSSYMLYGMTLRLNLELAPATFI